ncbi:MAG: GNAT family N-acetyltransferase [Candidatus Dormibacteraeota bacterium]|nr:GNAT family N-acetyltransferase [Candidatus Dormibacteraeota bacterium]
MTYQVDALAEDDWAVLRSIRLEALADAPTAFGSTLATEQEFSEERWRERAGGSAGARFFVAWRNDAAVGIAGVFDESDGTAQMVSVWVHPQHRGRGVASQLTSAALRFAAAQGFAIIRLWVTDGNVIARTLYERLGFTLTGKREPLPSHPSLDEHELQLVLTGDAHASALEE